MQPPEYDFRQPTRQSSMAIVLIIFRLYKSLGRQLLPIMIAFLFGKNPGLKLVIGLSIFLVVVAILGVISFFRYYFYVDEGHLIIEKGIFQKSKTSIPFERIQSINFEQNLIHQALSVVKLELDTAGSDKVEFDLQALSREKANALQAYIMARRTELAPNSTAELPTNRPIEVQSTVLFQLHFLDLLKVGLTQNHLRSGLWPFIVYFWLRGLLEDADIDLDDYLVDYIDEERLLNLGMLILGILLFGYLIVSVLISLIFSVFRYFGLSFLRIPDGYRVEYGLFTKRQLTMRDPKIQLFTWRDNLLRKIPGIYSFQIKQAATESVGRRKSTINLAGVSDAHIARILAPHFQEKDDHMPTMFSISPWLFYRHLGIGVALMLTVFVLYFVLLEPFILLVIPIIILYVLAMYLRYRKIEFGVNDEVFLIKGGIFGHKKTLFRTYKMQGVRISASPFQRRRKLASITLFSAAGTLDIPYVTVEVARHIRDYVSYRIESDSRDWM